VKDAMTSIYGREVLYLAAENCELEKVRRLLDHGAAANDDCLDYLCPPTCLGHVDIVRLLLENSASPDGNGSSSSSSPLHCCLRSCQTDMASLLLEYKAQVDSRDEEDKTCLMSTSDGDWCQDFQKQVPMAQLLLAHSADVNATTAEGWSSLHFACKSGNESLVHLLIALGASVNAVAEDVRSRDNCTALTGSDEGGETIPCRTLGCSPLTIAVEAGHLAVVSMLAANGAIMTAAAMHTANGEVKVRAVEYGSEMVLTEDTLQSRVGCQLVSYQVSEDNRLVATPVPEKATPSQFHHPQQSRCTVS